MYFRKSIRFLHLPDDHSGIARSNVVCDRVKKNVRKPETQLNKSFFILNDWTQRSHYRMVKNAISIAIHSKW